MTGVFDGLPDIFIETFGEPVSYTPAGGDPVAISAIWTQEPIEVLLGDNIAVDAGKTQMSVRAVDVTPREGDSVTRIADNTTMTVVTPIRPDGKGMIVCDLTRA